MNLTPRLQAAAELCRGAQQGHRRRLRPRAFVRRAGAAAAQRAPTRPTSARVRCGVRRRLIARCGMEEAGSRPFCATACAALRPTWRTPS